MMEEQPFGLPQYKNKNLKDLLNKYIDIKYPNHGNCESCSLIFCWYFSNIKCFAAQAGGHTIVLFDQKLWIDLTVGIIISKDFSMFQKLVNYNHERFEMYWGSQGTIVNSNLIFKLIRVYHVRDVKIKRQKRHFKGES